MPAAKARRVVERAHDPARQRPADRLLVETDSPYLAPIPHRGKPNLPQYVREVAEFLAMLRGESYERFAEHRRMFLTLVPTLTTRDVPLIFRSLMTVMVSPSVSTVPA